MFLGGNWSEVRPNMDYYYFKTDSSKERLKKPKNNRKSLIDEWQTKRQTMVNKTIPTDLDITI
jgi:hypothetical protein